MKSQVGIPTISTFLSTSNKLKLFFLLGHEGIQLSEITLETILRASNGDMRKAVTFLQSAHQLSGGKSTIPAEVVVDISGQVITYIVFSRYDKLVYDI